MPLSAVIRQGNTDIPYHMQVVYNKNNGRWILQFSCMVPNHVYGEEHAVTSFAEALRRFNSNCRYYGLPEQYCTEEEFLGVKEGVLFPRTRKSRKGGRK